MFMVMMLKSNVSYLLGLLGRLMATTAGDCTEVLLDPPLPEVAAFRNTLENVIKNRD